MKISFRKFIFVVLIDIVWGWNYGCCRESEPRNVINDGKAMYVTGYYPAMNLDQKSIIAGPHYDLKGPAVFDMSWSRALVIVFVLLFFLANCCDPCYRHYDVFFKCLFAADVRRPAR